MVDLPVNELVVSPVTLAPSYLNVKVLSIAPFGRSAVAFQLPLMSAANALKANSANSTGSHFIFADSFQQSSVYTGAGAHSHPHFRPERVWTITTLVLILHAFLPWPTDCSPLSVSAL